MKWKASFLAEKDIMSRTISLKDVLGWLKNDFSFPVPDDYLTFLKNGDFKTTLRKNYIIDLDSESVLEISDWFTYKNLSEVYSNSREEKMIENIICRLWTVAVAQ